jgi:hypothetical protein
MNEFKKYWKNWSTFSRILFILAIISACCCMPLSMFFLDSDDDNSYQYSNNDKNPTQSNEIKIAPLYSDIYKIWNNKTDIQQNKYEEELKSYYVDNWAGIVIDVDEGEFLGYIYIRVDINDDGYADVYISTDKETGLKFNKWQEITFSGNIYSTGNIFGLTIYINNAIIE